MIVALHNGAPARPYFVENNDTMMSLKAMIPSKRLRRDIKHNVATIHVLKKTGCEESAEFLLFAANNIDKAMSIVEGLWLMRRDLDDTGLRGAGEPASKSPELEMLIQDAEDILYPKNGEKVRYEGRDANVELMPRPRPPAPASVVATVPQPVVAFLPPAAVPEARNVEVAPPAVKPALADDGLPPPVADEDILPNTPRKIAIQERLK